MEHVRKHFDQRLFDDVIVITDVSSGLNDRRTGLFKLMKLAQDEKVSEIAIGYKDWLTRLGFNYLKTYFDSYNVKVHVVNDHGEKESVYEELVKDLLSIVTSFSGKFYGIRSRKKEDVINRVKAVIEDAGYLSNADQV